MPKSRMHIGKQVGNEDTDGSSPDATALRLREKKRIGGVQAMQSWARSMTHETTSKTRSNDRVELAAEEKTLDRQLQEDAFTSEGAPPQNNCS